MVCRASSWACRVASTGRPTTVTPLAERFAEALRTATGPARRAAGRAALEPRGRAAARRAAERDWRRRKARVDAAAAAVILQDYLDLAALGPRDRVDGRAGVFPMTCTTSAGRAAGPANPEVAIAAPTAPVLAPSRCSSPGRASRSSSRSPWRCSPCTCCTDGTSVPGDSRARSSFVEIARGSGVATIARQLEDAGVVSDAGGSRGRVAPERAHDPEGRRVPLHDRVASPLEVIDRLVRGDVYHRLVTFREGLSIREKAAVFAAQGLGDAQAFLDADQRGPRRRGRSRRARPRRLPLPRYLRAAAIGVGRRRRQDHGRALPRRLRRGDARARAARGLTISRW
jgi:hypothetical protein